MEKIEIHIKREDKTPTKKKKTINRTFYCAVCRSTIQRHEALGHTHDILHHRELEEAVGKAILHTCQACKEPPMSLNQYEQHISTAKHKAKFKSLTVRNPKPIPLEKTVDNEMFKSIMERNRKLKAQEKKGFKKGRKKQKQEAGHRCTERMQAAGSINIRAPKDVEVAVSRTVKDTKMLKQTLKHCQKGSNTNVFKDIENKVSNYQRPPHQGGAIMQNPSLPASQTWQKPNIRDQFTQSVQQMRYNPNFVVHNQSSKSGSLQRRESKNTQEGTSYMPGHPTWPPNNQDGCDSKQFSSGSYCDFTSDRLPYPEMLIFGSGKRSGASQSEQIRSEPAKAAPENNTAPIRDVDISAMLKQIRRALGVREPCRADREARKQSSETGNRLPDPSTTQQAGAEKEQAAGSSNRDQILSCPASGSSPHTSHTVPARPKQARNIETEGVTQSSVVSSGSNGAVYHGERVSQAAGQTSTSEQNITRKVRVAHYASSNLLNVSGAQKEQSWTEMYKEKKLERTRRKPRFGIELGRQTDKRGSTRTEDSDLPLSEGFHWESVPESPSAAHLIAPPPPSQGPVVNPSGTQLNVQTQEPVEPPAAAQDNDWTVEVPTRITVKTEPSQQDDDGENRSNTSKRKSDVLEHGGDSDEKSSKKKKKTKPQKDQDQMDQLLAVSLREEELSQTLQDLDNSLIHARNALQAAYAEVQRMLLMRQQCTAEVNSLRARRIEILQGMQGVYLGASNSAEKATTSSAGPAAIQQRLSPLSSAPAFYTASSQPPLSTTPASSISQPQTTALARQIKKEKCELSTDKPPVNQPVQLFPPALLPSLLLSPHTAAPTSPVNPLVHVIAGNSALVNSAPESSARLSGHAVKGGTNDQVQSGEAEDPDNDVPTAGSTPTAELLSDDKGSESDSSVEMMEPSNVVINIDESDAEEPCSQKEPPQKSVKVEFSSAGTQAKQKGNTESEVGTAVKDSSTHPEPDVLDEELHLGAFINHNGPVHGLQVHEGRLYTCSGDNTARAYCLKSRESQAVFEGHTSKINCLLVASFTNMPARLFTGSSDQTIRCYSTKTTKCLEQITLPDRVLCLHVAWNILFAGLANGSVATYDLKTLKELDVFDCHGPRGISCLGTAQEGARRVLLVGSYDSTISVRDAKSGLLLRSLEGHTKTVLCMKVVNDLVFSGSSDTSVHAHNIHTGELIRIYKGHGHAVTSIVILGKVMVTACLDKLVRVYELQSHDRLQVYGGHSDMVMCMAIHKSVIYTGCYDGSVQAVKLNLMKNYRCWWQNCSLIFGMAEHLVQHLVQDHTNPNLQMAKCRWRGCSSFFSTQQKIIQELPAHMKNHVEKDSKVQQ